MRADSQKVIQIKDDDDDQKECNNRIVYLRAQRICERTAKQCNEVCLACDNHGDQRLKNEHFRVPIDNFIRSFQNLQATCSTETQHYIRQINEAQKKAIDMISKKKDEYLKQIEEVKAHMMKKTYRTLEEKYSTLYEKYKNQRLDLLKCCEVFWVLNAAPSSHSIKHSEINKKLEGIIKKFESFKQVQKNLPITENIFTNKQRVKKAKISQKIGAMTEVRKDPVHIQKVDYGQQYVEKYQRQITRLDEELNQRRLKLRQAQQQLSRTEKTLLYRLQKLKIVNGKLKIESRLINFKYPQSNTQVDFKIGLPQSLVLPPPSASLPPPPLPVPSSSQRFRQTTINQTNDRVEPDNNKGPDVRSDKLAIQPIQKNEDEMINQADQDDQDDLIVQQSINQSGTAVAEQAQATQKAKLATEEVAQIKLQATEQQPFVQWENTELVQDIRKYGKKFQDGLKVQEIDRLRSFTYVRPPQTTVKMNANLLKKPQSLLNTQKLGSPETKKVKPLNQLASLLFQKHQMKKIGTAEKANITEKSQKKPEPEKQP